jgi:hypothetical protein
LLTNGRFFVKTWSVRAAALSATLALLLPTVALATSPANTTAVAKGLAYLGTQKQPDGSFAGFAGVDAWVAMAYSAVGTTPDTTYLKAHPPAAGATATEWERDLLAISAAGQNPYNFGGVNYVAGLKALHTGGQLGSPTAVNDDFFGIAALVGAGLGSSDPALTDALAFTLAHQHADGGFSYTTDAATGSDTDDTSAAIIGLEAAKNAAVAVPATALTNARAFLLSKQNADGGFLSDPAWGTDSNVSSSAWALMALNSLGEQNGTPGTAVQVYLRGTQQQDGSFPYMSGPGDTFDSAYAVMALAGGDWPQHVYDGPVPSPSVTPSPSPTPAGSVLGASTGGPSGAGTATLPAVGSTGAGALAAVFTLAWFAVIAAAIRRRTQS